MTTGPAPTAPPTDEALMARAADGDAAAFDALFARHAPRLGAVLRRGGLDREEAQELLQQTFLVVWRSRREATTVKTHSKIVILSTAVGVPLGVGP